MKRFLKRFFIFLVCYEIFFFFRPHSSDVLLEKLYEPLDVSVDTMDFSNNPEKKLGFDAYVVGNYKLAESHLLKAFEFEPNNNAIIYGIGICRMEKGDFENANTFFLPYLQSEEYHKLESIKIWYCILCNYSCFKYWHGGVEGMVYSTWMKHQIEDLIERKGRYSEEAKIFKSEFEQMKWYNYLLDRLDEKSIQGIASRSIFYRNNYKGGIKGFGSLKGIEGNDLLNRFQRHNDSIRNAIRGEYEIQIEMVKDPNAF